MFELQLGAWRPKTSRRPNTLARSFDLWQSRSMFSIAFGDVLIDCDPGPCNARMSTDPPGESSLDPALVRALLESDSLADECECRRDSYLELDFGG